MGIVFFKRRTDPFLSAGGVLTAGCSSFPTYWFKSEYDSTVGTDYTTGQNCPGTSYSAYFSGYAGQPYFRSYYLDTTYENSNFVPLVSERKNVRIEGTLNIFSGAGCRFGLVVKDLGYYGYNPGGYQLYLDQTQGFTTASIIFRTQDSSPPFQQFTYNLGSVPTGSAPEAIVTLRMDMYSTDSTTDVIKIYRKTGGIWSKLTNDIILTPGNGFKSYYPFQRYYQGYVGLTTAGSPQNMNGSIRNVSITVASASLPLPD